MSAFRLLLAAAAVVASADLARAIFLRVEVEKVPVERLQKNMEEAIKKNPKDAAAVLNLARLHAMAYSLRSEEVPVDQKRPDAIWFGYEPPLVPFRNVTKTDDKDKLKAAKEHLDKALKLYEDAIKLDPKDLRAQLGRAWLLTQTDKKDEAIKALRAVAEKGWESDQKLKSIFPGSHVYTPEVAGYLAPLLDKEKDKDELATFKDRIAQLQKLPRAVTPIAVPLADGLKAADIEDRAARVAFDADGSGLKREWTWINPKAAWLVHDPKRTGKVDSALQLFGGVTFWLFWETGYDALAALDDNGDGQLTGTELDGLALWHDANGNGVCDAGEVKPLAAHGVTALACKFERDRSHPDGIAFAKAGVTFANGRTRPTFDLVLHPAKK
ncbi:MAG: tetratricopeptide repeat protein [Planctomycetes bacterium]|nr:tetratricopeptide repeat protein [Planctomycetota bacterium]